MSNLQRAGARRLIPEGPLRRAFAAGTIDDWLELAGPAADTARPVFDFPSIRKGGWPQSMRATSDGRRLVVAVNQAGGTAPAPAPLAAGLHAVPRTRKRGWRPP